ncbi:MAG: hypothetical protein CVU00_07040 [Bacteroidetes bacterium HGW-Bacteroidetes-17]|jgi:hypothetical protein|nr:MAG: hypothetical protein CVU00_07040 [Bacteroidetes bacterium HGW-Bacteroidetes-17]
MKKLILLLFLSILMLNVMLAQSFNDPTNTATKLLDHNQGKLTIGGYGQIDFNQKFDNAIRSNGTLDVHRMVLLFGYQFSDRVDFVTELEFEHVKEVFVEQAFIRYKLNEFMALRAGLILIPMGIINEYHEPTTFNGVERPSVAGSIIPTTWREIGAGLSGKFTDIGLKYQAYIVNGLNGYDGNSKISGAGIRSGRQKGAESFISSPNLSFKLDYFGVNHLKLGLAGYFGKTQSTLYNGADKNNNNFMMMADSTIINLSVIGLDLRYENNGFSFRSALIYGGLANTMEYNTFTGSNAGSAMHGFYAEAAYDVFVNFKSTADGLTFFVRYENLNTQSKVEKSTTKDDKYAVQEIITGVGYKIADGVVLKSDFRFYKNKTENKYSKQFNAGVAVWF